MEITNKTSNICISQAIVFDFLHPSSVPLVIEELKTCVFIEFYNLSPYLQKINKKIKIHKINKNFSMKRREYNYFRPGTRRAIGCALTLECIPHTK